MTFRVTSEYRIRSNAVGVLVYVRQRFVKARHRVNDLYRSSQRTRRARRCAGSASIAARDVFRSSEAAAVALEEMRVDARRVQLGLDAPQAHRRMTGGARPEQHT